MSSASDGGEPGKEASRQRAYEANNLEDRTSAANQSISAHFAGIYTVISVLGAGAEGTTYLVKDSKNGGKEWAVKLIKLPLPTRYVHAIFREIKLQSEMGEGHHNIVTPEEVVLMSQYLGLVMEYVGGGSMTQYITEKFKLCRGVGLLMPEDEARYFFRQIVCSIDYCHKNHVAHRDLKLDNTLLM